MGLGLTPKGVATLWLNMTGHDLEYPESLTLIEYAVSLGFDPAVNYDFVDREQFPNLGFHMDWNEHAVWPRLFDVDQGEPVQVQDFIIEKEWIFIDKVTKKRRNIVFLPNLWWRDKNDVRIYWGDNLVSDDGSEYQVGYEKGYVAVVSRAGWLSTALSGEKPWQVPASEFDFTKVSVVPRPKK